jgi:TRAP-type C4-dicarboxylate transport system permease small subunit
MDILIGVLKGRALYLAEFITAFAMLILMVLLVWGTFAHFQRSFDFASPMWSRDSSMDIAIPLWPSKLLAPIAFSVICLRLLLQLFSYGQAIVKNDGHPVGVPMIADAATQAAMEAEHVMAQNK